MVMQTLANRGLQMKTQILATELHILNMRTRMPFRYGIAEMTALPHLFVRVRCHFDGREQWGIAAEGLPPKWFTKNPDTHFREDLDEMLSVIRHACQFALDVGEAANPCNHFLQLYASQNEWSTVNQLPPLLTNLGVSLIERGMIDAFCRHRGQSFGEAVRTNAFGIDLARFNSKLQGKSVAELLPTTPLRTVAARHTIGFGDPLTDTEILDDERILDGLPHSLEESITTYGLNRFKVKINGDIEADIDRLRKIRRVIQRCQVEDYGFTLDGNEQFQTVEHFRGFWEAFVNAESGAVNEMQRHLLFVEQPFHRDIALTDGLGRDLLTWDERPFIIIDESDGELLSFDRALDLGYCGTSHKNCKGIFKGIANACLVATKQVEDPTGTYILSGEDLCNVGPVALLQDLAVMATLGISHVERNGHHYIKGLSAFPSAIQQQVRQHHGDLYRHHASGFPTLNIEDGRINLGSVVDAPFGLNLELDSTQFTPLDQWSFETL